MAFEANPGTAALGMVLSRRMREESASPPVVDFGEILPDGSLTMNRFPGPIPAKDYTVCRHLCEREAEITEIEPESASFSASVSGGAHGGHEEGNGTHSHQISGSISISHKHKYKTRYLQPGDRVLVVRVGDTRTNEAEFCVLDVIVPALDIQKEGEVL